MREAYICAYARTPIGRYGGSLAAIRTDDLLGMAMTNALRRAGVPGEAIEEIAAGTVNVAHEGMGDIARWAALAAGIPDDVPAYTINRFCASSLTAAINISNSIAVGEIGVRAPPRIIASVISASFGVIPVGGERRRSQSEARGRRAGWWISRTAIEPAGKARSAKWPRRRGNAPGPTSENLQCE